MALGQITKQLAQQALGNSAKNMLDSLRPSELPRIDSPATAETSPQENPGAVILGEVKAMQNALKDDAELVVLVNTGFETLRVLEFFVPSPHVAVLTGIDTERNVTRFVSRSDMLQLTCKVMKVQPGTKPARIAFIAPKPKAG